MRVIEMARSRPTLDEVLGQAKDEPLVLRQPDGSMFILSKVDDFDVEVGLLKNNLDFMAFLWTLSQQEAVISLQDLRKELDV
jgi:hypothetical protein